MLVSMSRPTRSRLRDALVAVAVLLAAAACGSSVAQAPPVGSGPEGFPAAEPDGPLVAQLSGAVTTAGAMAHLQALQKIADENGGNRVAGSPGYQASVEYVAGVLRDAGFTVDTPSYSSSDEDSGGEHGSSSGGRNVITQTRTGDPGQVVMVGAHLDSVQEGPGIVDDGSGVATLLEIATRLGTDPQVRNAVRFAFFDEEEEGARGSSGYVQGLSDEDRNKIKLYLNVDMVASPNAGYFFQGGTGDEEEKTGPPGSATVGRVLADQLAKTGVTPQGIRFVGDDESAFIAAGIPVGGAENGDAKKKTAEQAAAWGGKAGEVYDPCYHAACDRIENVNQEVLDKYLRAIAGTVAHFATSNEKLR